MSSAVLFVAGAIITFIALWGVVMAGGLYATRHQPPDDAVPNVGQSDLRPGGAVVTGPAVADHPIVAPAPVT